jgi:D-alanyl-D-alanine carboxypeptidase
MRAKSSSLCQLRRQSEPRHARVAVACVVGALLTIAPAEAAGHHIRHRDGESCRNMLHAFLPVSGRDAALVVDGQSGQVLYARNAAAERHPASLTKMMTLYLLFDALKAHRISLATPITISRHAAAQLKVNLNLSPGMTMSVETAIKAIIVKSANDVAVAVAEAVGGTEGHFAQLMTAKARAIGMRNTFYHNASGLPDVLQVTTADDLALLARRLAYDFPQYYPYFATPSFSYHGMTYYTHDNLLYRFKGTDGIKTGFTNASGFNLVSSVVRDGAHVIGVVMGGNTALQRDNEMVRLLAATFVRVHADPSLVEHGVIPWKSPPAESVSPPPAAVALPGPPAPVIALAAPTFNALLAKSGEIDEDMAESYVGDASGPEEQPNCVPRRSSRRV